MKFKIINLLFVIFTLALLGYAGGNGINYLTNWIENEAGQFVALLVY